MQPMLYRVAAARKFGRPLVIRMQRRPLRMYDQGDGGERGAVG